MNIGMYLSFQTSVFALLGYIPRSGIAGSCGTSIFNFLKNFHVVFHSGCISLHSHQKWEYTFPHPHQPSLFEVFLMRTILTDVRWFLIVVWFAFLWWLAVLFVEKAMAPHSSTLARKIPWMEEPGGLQSMGSWRARHDWATSLSLFTFMHWRRKWQPTPVFLSGESQGWGSLVGCHLWGRTESDMTGATSQQQQQTSKEKTKYEKWSKERKNKFVILNDYKFKQTS